jgi:hypothetical protein
MTFIETAFVIASGIFLAIGLAIVAVLVWRRMSRAPGRPEALGEDEERWLAQLGAVWAVLCLAMVVGALLVAWFR